MNSTGSATVRSRDASTSTNVRIPQDRHDLDPVRQEVRELVRSADLVTDALQHLLGATALADE